MTGPSDRLTTTAVARNQAAWDYLASVSSSASSPWPPASGAAEAQAWLDEFGWLPWDRLRSVLLLCGAGGQQSATYAGLGLAVTVVDLSAAQLAVDQQVAARRGLSVECVQADVSVPGGLSALAGRTFDLVHQPASTCYLPDPRVCYRSVAALLGVGGLYLSEHWNPVQMQLDEPRWDGEGYRVVRRPGTGEPIRIVDPSTTEGPDCAYFAHRLSDLLGGICDAGFVLERFAERGAADADAEAGSGEHLGAYLAPFYSVLARRVADAGSQTGRPDPAAVDATNPRRARRTTGSPLRRKTARRGDLASRWHRQGFVLLRDVLGQDLVAGLQHEWTGQHPVASESVWSAYGLSDDGTYVSGGMQFHSAPPGPRLERLHHSAELLDLVRQVTGNDRIVASENLAYMYYDDGSFIDLHTDVPQCEVTVLTSLRPQVPPLVAYPRLRNASPRTLLAVAERTRGRPPGGVLLEVPVGGLLLIDGRNLPHRRPPLAAGAGPVGIAALCFVQRSPDPELLP